MLADAVGTEEGARENSGDGADGGDPDEKSEVDIRTDAIMRQLVCDFVLKCAKPSTNVTEVSVEGDGSMFPARPKWAACSPSGAETP